jgi:large repetitive protein
MSKIAHFVFIAALLGSANLFAGAASFQNAGANVSPNTTSTLALYDLSGKMKGNNTILSTDKLTVTFPTTTDVTTCTGVDFIVKGVTAAGTNVVTNLTNRTVTFTTNQAVPKRGTFTMRIKNITNPTVPGTKNASLTLTDSGGGNVRTVNNMFSYLIIGPPSALQFNTQPTSGFANALINPPPANSVSVKVVDAAGTTVTTANNSITLSIKTGTAGAVLTGGGPVDAINGIATFSNLKISLPGTYTLEATSAGLTTSPSSSSFTLTTSTANRLIISSPVPFTNKVAGDVFSVTVQVQDQFGNVTNSTSAIKLVLHDNLSNTDIDPFASGNVAAGTITFSNLTITKASNYTIRAIEDAVTKVLLEDATNSFNLTAKAAVKVGFSVQPVDTIAGAPFTVTVAGLDEFGNVDTTYTGKKINISIGSVTAGGTLIGNSSPYTTDGSGAAVISLLSIQKAGTYSLSTSDGEIGSPLPSSESNNFKIVADAAAQFEISGLTPTPGDTLIRVANPIVTRATDDFGNVDEAYLGTATFTSSDATATINTFPVPQTISFVALDKGIKTFNNPGFVARQLGARTVTLTDNDAVAPIDPALVNINVILAPTTTITLTSQDFSPAAQQVTFTAVVSFTDIVEVNPTGTVTFTIQGDPTPQTIALTGDTSILNYTFPAAGIFTVTATYNGDSNFSGSQALLDQHVTANGSTIAITPPASTVFGQSAVFSLSLDSTPVGPPTTGIVVLREGSTQLAQVDVSTVTPADPLVFTLSTSALTFGNHTIIAEYLGSGTTFSQALDSTSFDVGQGTTGLAISSSDNTSTFGESVTFTATVSVLTGSGNPTGTVSFVLDGGAAVVGTVNALTATFTPPTLSAGAHTLSVTYSGDTNFVGVSTPVVLAPAQDVAKAATTTVTADKTTAFSSVAQSVTLNATVTSPSGVVNTGNVLFTIKTLGNVTVGVATSGVTTSGAASVNYTLPAGTAAGDYNIIADYSGDSNLLVSTDTKTLSVTQAATKLGFTVEPSNTEAGASITPAVVVTVQDASGNTVTTAVNSITLAFSGNAGTAVLGGTTTVDAIAGVATFTGLSVNLAGNFALSATTTGGLTAATSATFTISDTVPPSFTSQPSASTTTATVGVPVTYTASATDVQGLTYTWDFGDGTLPVAIPGNTIDHTFATPGNFTVVVTVSDGSNQTTFSIQMTVAAAFTPSTDICAGLNPVNLGVTQVSAKLKFPSALLKDSIALKAIIQLNDGFNPAGQELKWDIAGITTTVNLDLKGNSPKSTTVKASVKYKKPAKGAPFTARPGKLSIAMKGQSLTALKVANFPVLNVNSTSTKGDAAGVDICVVLTGHQAYEKKSTLGLYKSKLNKGASFSAKFKL